ncbi:MAG: LysR family transcriptional regulator [Pseudomonadota bacterium]
MQWNDYRLMLAVARTKKLPDAAKVLGQTVSTMFRRLERIEVEMEGPVFHRENGIYTPNEVGAELCRAAERMEHEAIAAERKVRGTSSTLSGTLTVAASEVLATFFVARHVSDLNRLYPELSVNLLSGNDVLSLTNREADVALRPVRPTDEALFGRKLTDIHWAVYGDKSRKDRLGEAGDFQQEAFVGLSGNPLTERAMKSQMSAFSGANIQTSTNSLILTASSAAHGVGLALIPMILGEQWPGLHRISAPIEYEHGELWIVCHRDMRSAERVRMIFEALIAGAKSDCHLFVG